MSIITKRILVIFGTRPEAIKLASIIQGLKKEKIKHVVCVTGQHRQMLDQVLELFNIIPKYDLNIMTKNQGLSQITSKILIKIDPIIQSEKPDIIIVQGDTTSAFIAGLAAFYHKIKIAHIEAGLRTNNKYNPFPEEINRRLLSHLADFHFTPTMAAKENLLKEGIEESRIFVTGNTVIDSLLLAKRNIRDYENEKLKNIDFSNRKIILLTTHRRENLDGGMDEIFKAINLIARDYPHVLIIFPVHLNPSVLTLAKKYFQDKTQVVLTEPLSYSDLVKLMNDSYLIMTDSGGIQEEAPSLGKPVLVLRKTTERPEGVKAGTAILAGTDTNKIVKIAKRLLNNKTLYDRMSKAINPYGDGVAAKKIIDIMVKKYQ